MKALEFILDGRTTRSKLWRTAYLIDYHAGTKLLLGNRRTDRQPAFHAWWQRNIGAYRTEGGRATKEYEDDPTFRTGPWFVGTTDAQTDRQTDSQPPQGRGGGARRSD